MIDTVNRVFGRFADERWLGEFPQATNAWSEQFTEHTTARTALPGRCRLLTAPAGEGRRNSKDQQHRARSNTRPPSWPRRPPSNPGRTIGVLVRRNKAITPLIYELRETHHLFASQEGGNPLTDSPAVELVLSLLAMADHPGDTVARFHVAHSPLGKAIGFTDHADDAAAQRLATALRDRCWPMATGRRSTAGSNAWRRMRPARFRAGCCNWWKWPTRSTTARFAGRMNSCGPSAASDRSKTRWRRRSA